MAATSAGSVEVTIRIDLADAPRIAEIVRTFQRLGLTDAVPHPRLGIVRGSVPATHLKALREVAGVASVREDRNYRVQPG